MENESDEIDEDVTPVLSIIEQIKSKKLNPKTLGKETRQRCVMFFSLEGYTIVEIAQILLRSEKTISRDLNEIWKSIEVSQDPDFYKRMIDEYVTKTRNRSSRVTRLARNREASVSDKIDAEALAAQIDLNMMKMLHVLGYSATNNLGPFGNLRATASLPPITIIHQPVRSLEERPPDVPEG